MKALILAAGIGKRISKYTNGKPKCLLNITGKSLLEHQLSALEKIGIKKENIIIITGYKEHHIKEVGGKKIEYIFNPDYSTTNSIYSMWLARNENFDDGLFLLNADIVFHSQILSKLMKCEGNAVAIDFNKNLIDGEMNVVIKNNKILKIDKSILAKEANGESVQIVKLDERGSRILFEECDQLIKKGEKDKFPAFIFQHIIEKECMFAVDIEKLPWVEIDYPEDFDRAKQIYWECNE
jgi:L-glutamine-phosphate cytidylyltransferase